MNQTDPEDPEMWERVIRWWQGPDHNPRHMDEDLLEWVLTHHPKSINIKVNQEWVNAYIRELEAQGVEITPDIIPGLRVTTYYRLRPNGFSKDADASTN
jgi:hypothetical protein